MSAPGASLEGRSPKPDSATGPSSSSSSAQSLTILILAPLRNEGRLTADFLAAAGLPALICANAGELCARADRGCGALLLAEEALDRDAVRLLGALLSRQPQWSDLPLAVITSGGDASYDRRGRLAAVGASGNVALIERPFRPGTLISTLEVALRSRRRQYQVRDLLEQSRADAEVLRMKEERYRVLVASGNAWVWSMKADGSSDGPPAEWIAYTGVSAAASAGDAWADAIHHADREASFAHWIECVRERRIFEAEYRLRRFDGAYRWFAARGVPIFSAAGGLREWVGTMADIHDRRAAEEALRELAEQSARQTRIYETTLSSTVDLLYVFNLEGRFIYTNKRLSMIVGKTVNEILGRNFHDLEYPAELAHKLQRQIQQVVETGQPVRDETPYTGVTGTRAYEYIFAPIFSADGRVDAVAGVTRDITERQEVRQALEATAAALRDADRRKDEFLAMLAHELRNPLSSVSHAVSLLKETDAADNRKWAAEVIERQTRQLARLVDDLLDVSRITRGKIELRRELLDAALCLESACEAVAPLIAERNHTLLASISRGEFWLEADPTRLEQIVVNLLANAARYTEPQGHIWLEAQQVKDEIVIEVRDSGIGIAPENIPAMFELFAQGERSVARSEGGLGIGLTVVRGLCELHGGSVSARSEGRGTGSTFTVRLPAAAAPARLPHTNQIAPVPMPNRGAQVLVVDDNVDTALGLSRLLTRRGYTVHLAHDGPTALVLARAQAPAVVLLDIGLPGMDGYEVARRLRADPCCASVLIVALSGYGQEEDRERSRAAGFDHHLVKPVNFEEIHALLAELDQD